MTLDIIVTHYKEPWEVGKSLFDTIAIQRMVNLDDVGIILVNDGEENALPEEVFAGYPMNIIQMSIPKGGVSRARNAGLDASNANWIMFCDFDDCFSNLYGLYLLFCAFNENKYDTIWSCFTEESMTEDGKLVIVHHDRDYVFVHGKAHRRMYLIEKGIRFHDKLTIHEDVFLNMLAQFCTAPERVGGIRTPFYIWKWNGNSVVRNDRSVDFTFKTYDHLMRQKIALTEEFLNRGMLKEAMQLIIKTVVDCYYDCQQSGWRLPKHKALMRNVENWFGAYLKRYANYYLKADVKQVAGMAKSARNHAVEKGTFFMEAETLEQFLKRIVETSKPIPKWEQNV